MKKMSICLAIMASCLLVHAQKIEPPSFRDYLRSKNRFIKADTPALRIPEARNNYPYVIKDVPALTGVRKATLTQVLSNGNKLYLLPQDNMVCIVPDMNQFNMPVILGDNSMDKAINAPVPPILIIP